MLFKLDKRKITLYKAGLSATFYYEKYFTVAYLQQNLTINFRMCSTHDLTKIQQLVV